MPEFPVAFVLAALIPAVTFSVVHLVEHLRRWMITHSVSVGKGTEPDESLTVSTNFYRFDSDATREARLRQIWVIGETRRGEIADRMTKLINQEVARKQAEKEAGSKGLRPVC